MNNTWIVENLGAITNMTSGGTPDKKRMEYYEGGSIPWVRSGELGRGTIYDTEIKITGQGLENSSAKVFPKGTLLIALYGATIGKLAFLGIDACTNQAVCALFQNEKVKLKYLYYNLLFRQSDLIRQGIGGAQPNISQTILRKLPIAYPVSLDLQDYIVSRIEELFSQLDASVNELKTAKERLKVYRQAVLKEAFDQCEEFVPLSTLGELGRGKSKHRPRNDPALFEGGKYPFIQTGDVKAASKYITIFSKMYGEFGLQQSKLWPRGTLCITIAANIAETAFLGIDACFPDSVVGFTARENILPEYVRYFIESQKQRLWAYAPATAQKNINLDTLENLIIPYCSLEKQIQIVKEIDSRVTTCDSIEKTVNLALLQAEALRQSILKKAFEGKL